MGYRIETAPAGWSGFDRATLVMLAVCTEPFLRRMLDGVEPIASCAAYSLSARIAQPGIVASPVAWRREGEGGYGLMVRDQMGRLWIGQLDRVEGSRHGWVFTTTQGPFDPDLDGDQVDPRNLVYHRTTLSGVAA